MLAVVVPLVIFGWLTLRSMAQSHADAFTRTQVDTARVLASAVDGELHAWKTALTALAESHSLVPGRLAEFYEEARAVAARQDGWINVIDPVGRQQLNTLRPLGSPLPTTAASELLRAVLTRGQPVVGDLIFGATSQRWVISVAVPVVRDGKIVSMLTMSFPPDRLTRLLQRQQLPTSWVVAIQDSRYRVVTRLPLTTERMGKPIQPWFEAALRSTDQGTATGPLADGVPGRVAFNRLTEAPWFVALAIPLAAFPSARPVQRFMLLGVLLGLGALGLTVYVSRKLTRPVAELAASAERLLQGHAVDGISPSGVREIQHLQQALVTAATHVQALHREEARVAVAEERAQAVAEAAEALRQQREWLQVTLTSIGDAVLATDPAGRITFLNPVAEALTGWRQAEAAGQPVHAVFRLINERTHEPAEDLIAPVLREGRVVTLANHTALLARDGREIPIEDSAAPIRDTIGQVTGVVVVFHDVTEKRRAQDALQSVARFPDENPYPILRIARDGALLYANRSSEPLLSLWRCQVGQRLPEPWGTRAAEIYDRGRAEEVEVAGDAERIYACILTPILDAGYLNLYLRDITARKRAEEALRTVNADLERKVQERTSDLTQMTEALQGEVAQRLQAEAHLQQTNRLLRMLSACNEALVRLDDEPSLMQEICRILVELGGYRMAWVGLAADDADKSVRPVASMGFEVGYLEAAHISWADTERGRGPTGTAIRLGQVQIGTDFLTEPRLAPWRAEALARGFRSSIALPLRQDATVVGALTIYAGEAAVFSDAQIPVLLELAEDLAFGLHAVRMRTALRDSRDRLRALAGELTLAEHRERRRIAQILHDHLQQLLVAAKVRLTVLGRAADGGTSQAATDIAGLVEESLTVSRSLTAELSPPILSEAGVTPALAWLAHWMGEKHGLVVELVGEPDVFPGAGDVRVLLYEAVRELLFNVVKHAQVKTATVRVQQAPEDQVQVVVEDCGVGFDPPTVTPVGAAGGGFGLFSIRERLELVGGRLEVASAPGQGSRFTLTAPLGTPTVAGPPTGPVANAPVATPATDGAAPTPGATIRVLLADNHPVVRGALAAVLAPEPDIDLVGEAADGQQAIALTRKLRPDVVLMDISMPGLTGIEATRVIHTEYPGVRVIGLSMFEEPAQAAAMRDAGAVAYLVKSGPAEALLAALRAGHPGESLA